MEYVGSGEGEGWNSEACDIRDGLYVFWKIWVIWREWSIDLLDRGTWGERTCHSGNGSTCPFSNPLSVFKRK